MTIIAITDLHRICGGQQAAPAAPTADDRARQITREELDLDEKEREHEEFRAWEKQHPFSAMLCQGDRDCAGFSSR